MKIRNAFMTFVAAELSFGILVFLLSEAIHGDIPPQIVVLLFPLLGFGLIILNGIGSDHLKELRDSIPHKWWERIDQSLAMGAYGNPIPRDAVGRRWLKEIETAFDDIPTWPMWSQDPAQQVKELSDRDSKRERVSRLIRAAKQSRGIRLPAVATLASDD